MISERIFSASGCACSTGAEAGLAARRERRRAGGPDSAAGADGACAAVSAFAAEPTVASTTGCSARAGWGAGWGAAFAAAGLSAR